jgi:hypothetical protein
MVRGEDGQAMVEAALILPALVLVLLLTVQLTQLQRARLLADYAAFAAARTGIVLNGDPAKMREAAALAVLPGFGRTDGFEALARTLARFEADDAKLRPLGLDQLRIYVHSPVAADFRAFGQHLFGQEIDFDDVRPGAAEATLLSLQVRWLYELHVPFANQLIQTLWLALRGPLLRDGTPEGVPATALAAAARAGRYYLPVEAFYTMRMQSNPFLKWARQ